MKRPKILHRQRVNLLLADACEYPLTIVTGPIGIGKTTAVRNFLEEDGILSYWISFKNAAVNTAMLWDAFSGKISKLDPAAGSALKSLGFPADVPQTENVLELLSKENLPEKMIVVLDDYHLNENPALSSLILRFSSEDIENLNIILITRDTSEIDFVELLSKGLCSVITHQQLKFTESELREYCHIMAGSLSEDNIKQISVYADGWISFIYIILLGIEKGIPIGMNTSIEELIEEAIFNNFNAAVREFLIKLSIMDEFTARQAAMVTGIRNAQGLLKKLSAANAFIYYDEIHKIYKIHNILLDFLRMKQNFSEDERCELYRRLGEYYFQNKEFSLAYGCLYKAGQTERILSLLNEPSNVQHVFSIFDGVDRMFESTENAVLLKYPFAYLQYIHFSIVRGKKSKTLSWTDRLGEIERHYKEACGMEESTRNRVLGETLIVRKFTLFNRLEEMKASNSEIMRLLNGRQSYVSVQQNNFTFGSPHYVYIYFRNKGSFRKIAEDLSSEVGYSKFTSGCGTGCDSLAAAEFSLETGAWDRVEFYGSKAYLDAKSQNQSCVKVCAMFCMIRLRIFQDNTDEAIAMLHQLEKEIEPEHNPMVNTTLDLCRGYIYSCLLQPERIPLWLRKGDMTMANLYYQGIAFNSLVFGKSLMASKKFTELEIASRRFDRDFSLYCNQLGFIHNGIFKAVSAYRLHGEEAGLSALEQAINEARSDDIIMPFIESAPYLYDMLRLLFKKYPDDEFIANIESNQRQYIKSVETPHESTVPLSQRETDILELMACGSSRKEVANRLFISEETVKTHMKNIYQKLAVNGKVMAIQVAQAKGYISAAKSD